LTGAQQAQVAGERLQVRITGLPDAVRGQALELFPRRPTSC
jgi:hypothetical protein